MFRKCRKAATGPEDALKGWTYTELQLVARQLAAHAQSGGVPKRLPDRQRWQQTIVLHDAPRRGVRMHIRTL